MLFRSQIRAGTVKLYEYIIGGLFGAEMTNKQSTTFSFLVELMLSIPGATIETLLAVLEEPKDFIGAMEKLPRLSQRFFKNEFLDKQFNDTRKQIVRRLYGVLRNPAIARMFAAKENRLDLYSALNAGKIVVINTSKEFLFDDCKIFGRFCIAVAMKAALDRARIPEQQRRYSYLYIDEASDYFDENIGQLLVQARKYRLGLVLAHQALEQMSDGLRALIMANTSLKLAAGVSAKDARALAGDLRASEAFILAQDKDASGTRFACFARNLTPEAVSLRIPFGTMEAMPTMSDAAFAHMLAANRARISVPIDSVPDAGKERDSGDGGGAGGGGNGRGGSGQGNSGDGGDDDFSERY